MFRISQRAVQALVGISLAFPAGFSAAALHAQSSSMAGATRSHLSSSAEAVPGIVRRGTDLGPESSAQPVTVTVWLKLHNQAEFDRELSAIYTPGSPQFHKWMTAASLARFLPTPAEMEQIRKEIEKNGLTVLEDDTAGLAVRARGTVGAAQTAFHTQINRFRHNGQVFRANVSAPQLSGAAGELVSSVSGLDNVGMQPMLRAQKDPLRNHQLARVPLAKVQAAGGLGAYVTSNCFKSPQSITLTTAGASLPVGVYYGTRYDQGSLFCGYDAAHMQAAYGMQAAYNAGLKGQGQTIVIVEAYGSPTILSDANQFAKANGLPALDSSNFRILYPDGKPLFPSNGWIAETSLDVEWAHAIAPAAKIVLVVMPSQDDEEFQYAILYATMHHLGSVISNSYGYPEVLHGPLTLKAYDSVISLAAATGIAVNYSSGDGGDEGLGTPVGASLSPADSPHATSVGGTSLNVPTSNGPAELGWGNNVSYLSFAQNYVLDPPESLGFYGGAGGGESVVFAKPSWQKSLPGKGRQQPDISAVADPFTGGAIIFTDPVDGPVVAVYGGTSLACPIFSAMWALANQKAGHWLGQAAPTIAKMPAAAIKDILPLSNPTNVAGTVFNDNGATFYSATDLLEPLYTTTKFVSSLYNLGLGEYVDLSFGTDSSLTVTPGWDNVTGFGSPKGLTFINAAAASATKK